MYISYQCKLMPCSNLFFYGYEVIMIEVKIIHEINFNASSSGAI